MTTPLHVLLVEDNADDAQSILRALREGGHDPTHRCVENFDSLKNALQAQPWDVVLCDNTLPDLTGVDALRIVRDMHGPDIPFIFVSDAVGEETAVELMRAGAHDCVLKSNMMHLVAAVARELAAAAVRREKRSTDEILDHEQQLLEQLMANSPDAIYIKDQRRRYVRVNDALRRILNISNDTELLGKTSDDIAAPAHAHDLREEDEKLMATGEPLIDRIEKIAQPDGSVRWFSASKAPLKSLSGEIIGIMGVTRDITKRMQESEARMALQNRFNQMLDLAPDAIIATDNDQRITLFNKSAERIFGYRAEEVSGQYLDVLLPAHLAAGHRKHVENFESSSEMAKDMSARDSILGRRKNGNEFPAEAAISKYVEDGNTRFIAIVRDITDRRRAEEQLRKRDRSIAELNERLAQDNAYLSALNSELEAFSYSVSHDLRAPLRAIDGFSQMLQEDHIERLDDRGRDCLMRIRRAAGRMGLLIDDLLTLARISRVELKRANVDLSAQAFEVLNALQATAPARAAEFDIANGVSAYGDAGLLRIVLENLLNNAWKFSTGRTPARIEFGQKEIDGKVVYCVRDNGVGFNMAYAAKLFGAFQRLHDDRKFPGDGIGLAIVQRIINKHGGRIWVEAEPDKGAAFYFTL